MHDIGRSIYPASTLMTRLKREHFSAHLYLPSAVKLESQKQTIAAVRVLILVQPLIEAKEWRKGADIVIAK